MNVLPIDLTAIVAIVLGMMVVLIPIAGATARFALKPIAEAMAQVRATQGAGEQMKILEQRMALMEQQISGMDSELSRIGEVRDFEAKLEAPAD